MKKPMVMMALVLEFVLTGIGVAIFLVADSLLPLIVLSVIGSTALVGALILSR